MIDFPGSFLFHSFYFRRVGTLDIALALDLTSVPGLSCSVTRKVRWHSLYQ